MRRRRGGEQTRAADSSACVMAPPWLSRTSAIWSSMAHFTTAIGVKPNAYSHISNFACFSSYRASFIDFSSSILISVLFVVHKKMNESVLLYWIEERIEGAFILDYWQVGFKI